MPWNRKLETTPAERENLPLQKHRHLLPKRLRPKHLTFFLNTFCWVMRILCFRSFQSSRVPRLLCWKAELATFLNAAAKTGWPKPRHGNRKPICKKNRTFRSTFSCPNRGDNNPNIFSFNCAGSFLASTLRNSNSIMDQWIIVAQCQASSQMFMWLNREKGDKAAASFWWFRYQSISQTNDTSWHLLKWC